MTPKRNFATLLSTTTKSSNRTCSQTETSSLSAANVSFARVLLPASFIGILASGVHDTSFHNIMKCGLDIRLNLHVHVMLPGGTTMFQEIGQRMTKNPTELPPPLSRPYDESILTTFVDVMSCESILENLEGDVLAMVYQALLCRH